MLAILLSLVWMVCGAICMAIVYRAGIDEGRLAAEALQPAEGGRHAVALHRIRARLGDFNAVWTERERDVDEIAKAALIVVSDQEEFPHVVTNRRRVGPHEALDKHLLAVQLLDVAGYGQVAALFDLVGP